MKKKILSFCLAFALIVPAAFLLSACGDKKVQSITVDDLFISNFAEFEYGTNIEDIYSLDNMKVTATYNDNSTKVLNSNEYTIKFSKNSSSIEEIKSIPDVGYYEIYVSYEGFGQGGSFSIIPSETPYYTIALSHMSWTYGEDNNFPTVTLENYQLQEGDSVSYYYIEKSKYDALNEGASIFSEAYNWEYVVEKQTILDAGQYYVFAYITFANESNYTGLTVIDNNTLITVNKKNVVVTPDDAIGVSALKFDYNNSYNIPHGQSDGGYLIGDLALKHVTLDGTSATISGVEGYFDWKNPNQTLNSTNNGDSYPIIFIPYSSQNYNVIYNEGEITLPVSIEKGVIDNKSTLDIYFVDSEGQVKTITYDGEAHSLLLDNFEIFNAGGILKNTVTFTQNGESVVVREETSEYGLVDYYVDGLKEVGTYTFIVSILDKINYCWSDGSVDDVIFTVEIVQ